MGDSQMFNYGSVKLQTASTEIRLLDLYPSQASSDSRLIGRLHTTIKDPSSYTALSYVWGDGQKSKSIWIPNIDHSREANIAVTESLHTALRQLRKPNKVITLWIDQICINQADNNEKGQQVGLMGSIYSAAEQVLVWLGPAENDSDGVMDAWQDIGQKALDIGLEGYLSPEKYHLIWPIMKNENPADEATISFQNLLAYTVDIFAPLLKKAALKDWFERPYFSRVWIVQEFCLCNDTVFACGSKSVVVDLVKLSVLMLQTAIGNMRQRGYQSLQPPDMPLERLAEVSDGPTARLFGCRSHHQKHADDELYMLLRRLFVDHATNAIEHRDRVFALLALAKDAEKLGIEPDYDSSEGSTERILTQTARVLIERGGRVDILCYSQHPKASRLSRLPSWVPDWRSSLRPSFYTINERMDQHIFAASGQDSVVETVQDLKHDPNTIGLRGYTVDVIEKIAPGDGWLDLSWDHERYLGFFSEVDVLWQDSMNKSYPIHGEETQQRKEEARWRAPIGDIYWTWEGDQHRAPSNVATFHKQFLQELKLFDEMTRLASAGDDALPKHQEWKETTEVKHNYRESMRKMQGKRPFLTQAGYLGIGPVEAQPSDVVVIFCGGRIPFVLRRLDQTVPDMLSYVGEAYCDGVMDGEVTTKEKETFWLV
ncbi:HET-6OR heterokaryon incompatibility protein (het-6OR allele) [Fusarium austroafricanum]|uniref:HET-6OR heterokaryon incompatibility protein (Het-6OR allele) n=1 Tax=Fusarium austroafricanum TaxID=2364996 RepID=A0A8H4NR55_9HYPO|nr:HET-6OR heterokaryon incompatibility protein (het-6OR allele) [Fusarium austroafricanum]